MENLTLTKQQAADLFGGKQVDLAKAIGVSKQAVSMWPENLTVRQTDAVTGAAIRLGHIKNRRDIESLRGGSAA